MKVLYALLCAAVMVLPMSSAHAGTKDIVDTAAGAGKFSTLVAAVKAAGLVDTLKGDGPFTVFAPTDDAFMTTLGVDADSVCSLPQDLLTTVLLYHVTDGRRFSNSVVPKNMKPKTIETLSGIPFQVEKDLGIIDGNDVTEPSIVIPNINASNGVIHAVDEVLLPINL